MKKDIIIGIEGNKGVGKDTVASMIAFIIRTGPTAAFRDWSIKCDNIKTTNLYMDNLNVVHFADASKKMLSSIFNIPLEDFYDRDKKDNLYYCFDSKIYITPDEVNKLCYFNIEHIHLSGKSLSELLFTNSKKVCIKLRTLMQYFGTNVMRNIVYDNTWVDICIREVKERLKLQEYNYRKGEATFVLVPDVRFDNEAKELVAIGGKILNITRNVEGYDSHSSENNVIHTDKYIIENNLTKMALFYKVRQYLINEML